MKQFITIETTNTVLLDKFLKEAKLSVYEFNEITKMAWESLLDAFKTLMDGEGSEENSIKVINVETLQERLN